MKIYILTAAIISFIACNNITTKTSVTNNGSAFQIVNAGGQQICSAIFVHVKGKGVRDIYIDVP